MDNKKQLTRSNHKMIAGVCAGIAEYFDMDITLCRVLFAVFGAFSAGFPAIIAYIILWIVMPKKIEVL